MSLAVDREATRIWIVNVGDMKPLEMDIGTTGHALSNAILGFQPIFRVLHNLWLECLDLVPYEYRRLCLRLGRARVRLV